MPLGSQALGGKNWLLWSCGGPQNFLSAKVGEEDSGIGVIGRRFLGYARQERNRKLEPLISNPARYLSVVFEPTSIAEVINRTIVAVPRQGLIVMKAS